MEETKRRPKHNKHNKHNKTQIKKKQQQRNVTVSKWVGGKDIRKTSWPRPRVRWGRPSVGMTLNSTLRGNLSSRHQGPHRCTMINPQNGKPCNTIFSSPYDLTRHEDTIHNTTREKVRCAYSSQEGKASFHETDIMIVAGSITSYHMPGMCCFFIFFYKFVSREGLGYAGPKAGTGSRADPVNRVPTQV